VKSKLRNIDGLTLMTALPLLLASAAMLNAVMQNGVTAAGGEGGQDSG